jgi:hypothetical protein
MSGTQIQYPDFGRSLLLANQLQSSRLQQMAMQQEADERAKMAAVLPTLAPALSGTDPAARASALAQLAGIGTRGFAMASPMLAEERQVERQRVQPMTPEQRAQFGVRGAFAVDALGRPVQLEAADTLSPEAVNQRIQMARATREPPVTWQDVRDESGQITGQRSSRGQFQPLPASATNMFGGGAQGLALQFLTRNADGYAAGTLTPDQQRQFETALTIAQQPRQIYQDGQLITIPGAIPPFVAEARQRRQGTVPTQAPAQGAPAAAPPAPAAPTGQAPVGQTGMVADPPPAAPARAPGGVTVQQVAPSKQDGPSIADRSKLRSIEVEAQGIRDALQTFREARAEASPGERLQAAAGMPTRLSTTWSNAALLAKGEALYNLGVLNGPDLDIIRRTLTDPATVRGLFTGQETVEAQIKEIETLLDQRLRSARAQYGGQAQQSSEAGGQTSGGATLRWNPDKNRVEDANGNPIGGGG